MTNGGRQTKLPPLGDRSFRFSRSWLDGLIDRQAYRVASSRRKIVARCQGRVGMQSRRELLTAVYAAFNRRDIEGVLEWMRPDVDWPNGMEGGRVHGYDEVRAYWRRQWGILDPHVEPVRMEDDETGHTVVDVHQVVCDLSGNILKDQIVQHVYSFRDDLIERMDIRRPDTAPTHESSN